VRFNTVAVGTAPRRWAILLTTVSVVAAMAGSTTPSGASPLAPDPPAHAWAKHTALFAVAGSKVAGSATTKQLNITVK
jgi:hypothetical protein